MDVLDARILRELFRGRTIIWGGVDPRLGSTGIARRLGVDRTTVWARLKAWKQSGFLVRQEVVPNPALFGAGVAGGDVRVDDARRKAEVLEALALVDGVLTGVDHVGPYMVVLYAMESEAALERCRRLVQSLPHVEEATECIAFRAPRSTVQPTAADWRILAALRRAPDAPLKDVARAAGVSDRTLTRRYEALLRANAVWTFPVFDFTRYEGALLVRFVALVRGPREQAALVNAARKELAGCVWSDRVDPIAPPSAAEPMPVEAWCHLTSATQVEEAQWWLEDRPGVAEVFAFYPRTWFVVSSWFDERIGRALKG